MTEQTINDLTFQEFLELSGNYTGKFNLDEFANWRDGKTPVRRKRAINKDNLTYKEWRAIAGYSVNNLAQYEAWKRGEDPTEHRANPDGYCSMPD